MPGKFIDEVRIFRCGTRPDGSAIMCSEITWAKIPFLVPRNSPNELGWQDPETGDVHVPLAWLVETMKNFGITVSYDEKELERLLGPQPDSDDD